MRIGLISAEYPPRTGGVGDHTARLANELRSLGLPVVAALRGVGENLQDHLQIRSVYKVNNAKTLNTLANSLWGKARDYLESSLQVQRNPEACAELARLLAQLGDTERSNQLFQEGLGLLDNRLLASPLPAPARV